MKYSYNWLKELTGTKKSAEELAQMVMLRGFELEGIESLGERFNKFVVGEILEISKHPNADKLQLVKVDIKKEILEIVCGAHNIKIGDKVPVALEGAIVPLKKLKIEKTEIRGVKSHGMICAEDELGLGKDHSGIMILSNDAKNGEPLSKVLELDDKVLEFDILSNRAHDCLSYRGMANEIIAMESHNFRISNSKFKISNESADTNFLNIEIKDKDLCPRYMGAVMSSVEIKPSPRWMQSRLIASGMEPINNVVDITNYVMLEIGNPLHAFDFDKIRSKSQGTNKNGKTSIVIRKARKNEELELLSGAKLKLNESDLVIENEGKALALAGIKGGKYSGINDKTKTIILESANFNPFCIRKTRQRYAMSTEAQTRFEKGISPILAEKALVRAVELFQEHAGAKLEQVADENNCKKEKKTIKLEFAKVVKLLGEKIDNKKALKILEDLYFKIIKKDEKQAIFSVPYWRLDIEEPEDLIEEIGRIIGYDKIGEKSIQVVMEVPKENKSRKFEWKLKELAADLGFDEMINYSFYGSKEIKTFNIKGEHFKLKNPLNKEHLFLRKTLLPHMASNIELNQKHFNEFAIFELGRVYFIGKDGNSSERLKLAGAVFALKKEDEIFYDIKGRLESIAEALGLNKNILDFTAFGDVSYLHPKKSAKVSLDGKELGIVGEFSTKICRNWDIEGQVGVFEIDFDILFEACQRRMEAKQYQLVNRFPRVLRDISMFINCKTEAKFVENLIKKNGGEMLLDIKLFDVYWDKKSDKKSLAFHLEFGSDKRTLENREVDKITDKIIKRIEEENGEVRRQS